jgi:hypothetical protein
LDPTGILAIWHDIEPDHERAVLDWYNREHHPERVAIHGFLRARRHVALTGSPKYFICYEVATPAVLVSDEYLTRLNGPTAWTQRSMPWFRNNSRSVCTIDYSLGQADGAYIATLRLSPDESREAELRARIVHDLFPKAAERELFLKGQIWHADRAKTVIPTRERLLRGAADSVADWIVTLGASSLDVVEEALAEEFSLVELAAAGALPGIEVGIYALEYALEKFTDPT